MKWPLYVLVAGALSISVLAMAVSIYLTTVMATAMVNQQTLVLEYARSREEIAILKRENHRLNTRVSTLERQTKFIAAASRMGWGEAYKFMRSIDIDQ